MLCILTEIVHPLPPKNQSVTLHLPLQYDIAKLLLLNSKLEGTQELNKMK